MSKWMTDVTTLIDLMATAKVQSINTNGDETFKVLFIGEGSESTFECDRDTLLMATIAPGALAQNKDMVIKSIRGCQS